MKIKGNNVSGKGLLGRVADWYKMGGSGAGPVVINGMTYHKPGSQNPRKGGIPKSERKEVPF